MLSVWIMLFMCLYVVIIDRSISPPIITMYNEHVFLVSAWLGQSGHM